MSLDLLNKQGAPQAQNRIRTPAKQHTSDAPTRIVNALCLVAFLAATTGALVSDPRAVAIGAGMVIVGLALFLVAGVVGVGLVVTALILIDESRAARARRGK